MKRLLLLLLLLPSVAVSAPAVTSLSGGVTTGQSVTITGTGFGTKSTAAPVKYDDFEDGAVGNDLIAESSGGWETPTGDVLYSTTKVRLTGTKSAYQNFTNTYSRYIRATPTTFGTTDSLYFSGWFNFTTSGAPSRNVKILNFGSAAGWQSRLDVYPNTGSGHLYASVGCSTSSSYTQDWSVTSAKVLKDDGLWHRLEGWLSLADGGYREVSLDGVKLGSISGFMSGSCNISYMLVGHYFSRDTGTPTPSGERYWDELYVDTVQSRVEICPGASWSNRGACEIQLPTAWANTSVTATVKTGTLTSGSTAYLYVVDSAGDANTAGLPVVIGGTSSADTTPPVRTQLAPVGPLSYGTTSTTLSLTTNEAANCRYSTSSGVAYASMTDSFGSEWLMSHHVEVTDLSAGDYSYKVRCIDGSGNANTTDATIAFTIEEEEEVTSAGFLSWESASYTVARSIGRVPINLVRTGGSTGTVTVKWSTNGQTALHNIDYYGNDNVLVTFGNGVTSVPLNAYGTGQDGIELIQNGATEDRYFQLVLSEPTGGAAIAPSTFSQVTIRGVATATGGGTGRASYNANFRSSYSPTTITLYRE